MSIPILIIEDTADIREGVVEILELAGYTVYAAENGKVGVELAKTHLPHIILCDIMMPELDGYGVLYMLNKLPETANIPFIFLTARADRVDLRKAMEMGADDYLTKPFDDVELLAAIESRLKKQEQQKKFYSESLDQLSRVVSRKEGLAELQKIIKERKVRSFKKNQVIYYEGDKGNGLYVILNGKIKTSKLASDGRELITDLHTAGQYLGVRSLLADDSYSETACAVEDSQLCLIPKERLDEMLNLYPDVTSKFIKLLAGQIRENEDRLLQLAYDSVRKKMANAVLRLLRQTNAEDRSIRISREDLAAFAGMATETVSRTLSDFRSEGLIEKNGSVIRVLDLERLSKMKN
ncbi:cAMP-binding domain of CRP or a regulatory subunit of cAMP-dependent protein kinases [Mucilaginibacter gossypiicola]|uniref:cAMP-binding domain of CRP or a regulatory subunit of cAMP-dependent protein kinases n=1 Tax=Mucilaginibacter gossypiicola TaxID=551995 RepID=A0A1H8AJY5_9SPHI|nr:response regulator [Mucilaginibacter gossypiicola]SEM71092.1 cAMP-binding domain of CRP or a regulatory subunit of cAMP-dependent protein kinases [Mucilaginibacter gossypiicola]